MTELSQSEPESDWTWICLIPNQHKTESAYKWICLKLTETHSDIHHQQELTKQNI